MIHSVDKFFSNARWKAFFYLNPDKKSTNKKETYSFKSLKCGPPIKDLKDFEDEMIELTANIEFGNKKSQYQKDLDELVSFIEKDTKVWVKADKTNNYYRMDKADYLSLLDKEIQKEYKLMIPIKGILIANTKNS